MEKPNKYANGKIYRIDVPGHGTYVGSTCQRLLCMRRGGHMVKSRQVDRKHYQLYQAINSLPNKWEGIHLILIKNFPCTSKDELLAEEGNYIRELGTLNERISGRTQKEYRQENKEVVSKYFRKRNQDPESPHREKYLAYQRAYRSVRFTCPECDKEFSRRCIKAHIARHEA